MIKALLCFFGFHNWSDKTIRWVTPSRAYDVFKCNCCPRTKFEGIDDSAYRPDFKKDDIGIFELY